MLCVLPHPPVPYHSNNLEAVPLPRTGELKNRTYHGQLLVQVKTAPCRLDTDCHVVLAVVVVIVIIVIIAFIVVNDTITVYWRDGKVDRVVF